LIDVDRRVHLAFVLSLYDSQSPPIQRSLWRGHVHTYIFMNTHPTLIKQKEYDRIHCSDHDVWLEHE
jgi:hypothetical protein